METWQIFIAANGGQTEPFKVNEDCEVCDLFLDVRARYGVSNIRLFSRVYELRDDPGRRLSSFAVRDGSTVTLGVPAPGGIKPSLRVSKEELQARNRQLIPLPGLVEVVTEPDSGDPFDDDPTVKRAKMVCGHVFGTEAMMQYMDSVLCNDCDYQFLCPLPACRREWTYYSVQHVALLGRQQTQKYEQQLAENYIMKTRDMQQCGQCQTWCYRANPKSKNVRCPCCSTSSKSYDFCWVCKGQWQAASVSGCGNAGCTGVDPRVTILQTCTEKTIQYSARCEKIEKCPSIRACPKCGILIEHSDACKQMKCGCGHDFCFSCLKPTVHGALQCTGYQKFCQPAARQTEAQVVGAA